jgi:hypothetical protein
MGVCASHIPASTQVRPRWGRFSLYNLFYKHTTPSASINPSMIFYKRAILPRSVQPTVLFFAPVTHIPAQRKLETCATTYSFRIYIPSFFQGGDHRGGHYFNSIIFFNTTLPLLSKREKRNGDP